uniref:Uncharacterized protein n=1 Tax=Lygus hesperus TaxID=30085 RepID=A0A0A9WRG2_LYGHE
MNPAAQKIWRSKVIEPIYDYLVENEHQDLFFACMLFYETLNSTRPSGFGVFVTIGILSNLHLVKGYVPNPRKSSGMEVVPYVYSTGTERAIRISGSIYHRLEVKGDRTRSWRVRVEKAERVVSFSDLNSGTDIDEINKIHARKLSNNESDVPGQLINKKLGGRGDDPYNVVPMDPTALEALNTRVEAPVRAFFVIQRIKIVPSC